MTRTRPLTALLMAGTVALGLTGCGAGDTEAGGVHKESRAAGSWTKLPEAGAPGAGYQELTAVESGGRVVIVAGVTYRQSRLTTAVFDPESRRWSSSRSPLWWRYGYSAVPAGDEVIVWGGCCGPAGSGSRAQGMRYLPAEDSWQAMAESPLTDRGGHSAVWTGEEMIVWGGLGGGDDLSDGAAYDPARDSWREIPPAPLSGRTQHVAVWSGEEMVVWGGTERRKRTDFQLASAEGAAYDPDSDSWRRIAKAPIRSRERQGGTEALWTGEEMLVWNEGEGAAYDPEANTWRPLPAPPAKVWRHGGTVVWTGEEMIVWGGDPSGGQDGFDDGAAYSPAEDRWRPIPDAPIEGRYQHAAAWTGQEMLLWGGCCDRSGYFRDGALYRPR